MAINYGKEWQHVIRFHAPAFLARPWSPRIFKARRTLTFLEILGVLSTGCLYVTDRGVLQQARIFYCS